MEKEIQELKPCNRCGNTDIDFGESIVAGYIFAYCTHCNNTSCAYETIEEVIGGWNRKWSR